MESPIDLSGWATTASARVPRRLLDVTHRHREDILSVLRQVPAFVSAVAELAGQRGRYRVLVCKENLHLLREGGDGITKTSLRGVKGQFVENVNLIKIPPDVAGAIATVAIQATLTEVLARLDVVARSVQSLDELFTAANLGGIQGAIDALEVARHLHDEKDRRTNMLGACGQLLNELGRVAGQMKAHVGRMPLAETRFRTGWSGDGMEDAKKAWTDVKQDFAVLADAMRQVVTAYFDLGEIDAARAAFSRIFSRLTQTELQVAADRARLLPYPKGGPGPEYIFENFLSCAPVIEAHLRLLASGELPELTLYFEDIEVLP